MGLEVAPRRPLALMIVGAFAGRLALPRRIARTSYAPPARPTSAPTITRVDPDPGNLDLAALQAQCVRTLRGMLLGEELDDLASDLAPDVVVWSPTLYTTAREPVLHALENETAAGDTITEVAVSITNFDFVAPHAYLEWHLTGRFTNPCFVDDDMLVEPNGRLIETAGVMVLTLINGQAVEVHCYYDDLALLEQMMASE
jgi:hypothetical protein